MCYILVSMKNAIKRVSSFTREEIKDLDIVMIMLIILYLAGGIWFVAIIREILAQV